MERGVEEGGFFLRQGDHKGDGKWEGEGKIIEPISGYFFTISEIRSIVSLG
jgi:hypothetical protein